MVFHDWGIFLQVNIMMEEVSTKMANQEFKNKLDLFSVKKFVNRMNNAN
jgi:hypothetical protein